MALPAWVPSNWEYVIPTILNEAIMVDFVPQVDESDLQRIVARDFIPELRTKVLETLNSEGMKYWPSGIHRISLAVLKVANGNIDEVERQLRVARNDPRDVIAAAEYPRFYRLGFVGVEQLSSQDREQLKSDDWNEYQKWLGKKRGHH